MPTTQSSPSNIAAILNYTRNLRKQQRPTTQPSSGGFDSHPLFCFFLIARARRPAIWFCVLCLCCVLFVVLICVVCIGCSNTTSVLPAISQPSPSDQDSHPKSLKLTRASHPAISRRSTITTEMVGHSSCQPPSHLPAILQRFKITAAMFGSRQGQPPSHLPAISRPSSGDLDSHPNCF